MDAAGTSSLLYGRIHACTPKYPPSHASAQQISLRGLPRRDMRSPESSTLKRYTWRNAKSAMTIQAKSGFFMTHPLVGLWSELCITRSKRQPRTHQKNLAPTIRTQKGFEDDKGEVSRVPPYLRHGLAAVTSVSTPEGNRLSIYTVDDWSCSSQTAHGRQDRSPFPINAF